MNPHRLYRDFIAELQNRTHYLTEDSIRYYFFACMFKQDPTLDNYIMELPYTSFVSGSPYHIYVNSGLASPISTTHSPQQELDMYYYDNANKGSYYIEFKFHRNPAGKTYAHTDAAGRIINDIKRLHLIQPKPGQTIRRLLVYVTDDEMNNYLNAATRIYMNSIFRGILKSFYNSPLNSPQQFIFDSTQIAIPNTFISCANASFNKPYVSPITIDVKKVVDQAFFTTCPSFQKDSTGNRACHILIYEVF
jgi:hypothetical protein